MAVQRRRTALASGSVAGIGAAAVTVGLLVPILRLRDARLSVPFGYQTDGLFHLMLSKAVLDHGWYESNQNLGAPGTQQLHDFPVADNLHLAGIKIIGLLTDDFVVAFNAYFLIGFPLAAFFAGVVLGRLGVSPLVGGALAVLYALAPYHFVRGTDHLFLASYYTVPLGMLLVAGAAGLVPLFERRGRWGVSRGTVGTAASAALVGAASPYYAVFTILLLGVASVANATSRRSPSGLVPGVAAAALVVASLALNLAPDLLYASSHGPNPTATYRDPGDTETYGLKVTQLLLPQEHHRLPAFRNITARYLRDYPIPSERHPLGLVATAGLVGLLLVAAAELGRDGPPWSSPLVRNVALLALAGILIATIGGLATTLELLSASVLSGLPGPLLRGWNRMVIFLAFLSLVAVGVAIDAVARRFAWPLPLTAVLCVVVTAVGVLDQTSPAFAPAHSQLSAAYADDAEFVDRIGDVLPAQGMVFQLPFVPFPGAPPVFAMTDYDHLRPYLHSRGLRWSYGAVKGRPESDWAQEVAAEPAPAAVARLRLAGFDGIYVDRAGFADRAGTLEAELSALLGPPMISRDSRESFFKLN